MREEDQVVGMIGSGSDRGRGRGRVMSKCPVEVQVEVQLEVQLEISQSQSGPRFSRIPSHGIRLDRPTTRDAPIRISPQRGPLPSPSLSRSLAAASDRNSAYRSEQDWSGFCPSYNRVVQYCVVSCRAVSFLGTYRVTRLSNACLIVLSRALAPARDPGTFHVLNLVDPVGVWFAYLFGSRQRHPQAHCDGATTRTPTTCSRRIHPVVS
jgi:hypothetical protein